MKLLRQTTLVALLVGAASPLSAQVAGNAISPATGRAQLITPPQGGLSAHDYALELAKTANRNLIMDATDVSTDLRMPSYPTNPTPDLIPVYEFVLQFFRSNAGLSDERHGSTTLLWNSPNPVEYANAIVASGVLEQTDPMKDAEKAQLVSDLLDSSTKDDGWKKSKLNQDYERQEIKIGDLPEPLRARVLLFARQEAVAGAGDYRSWMSDEFWKTARVRPGGLVSSNLEGKPRPNIELSATPSPEGKAQIFYEVLPWTSQMKPTGFTNEQLVRLYHDLRNQPHQ